MKNVTYKGISAYAGLHKNFPAKRFMRQFPDNLAANQGCIAFLLGTFGWSAKLIELFIERFPKGLIEIHVSNGASRRKGRNGAGAYAAGYSVSAFNKTWEAGGDKALLKQLDNFATKWNRIIPTGWNARIALSPELEDNMTDQAFNAYAKACKQRFQPSILLRSPCMGGHSLGPATYTEKHGLSYYLTTGTFGNLDGCSIDFHDGEKKYLDVCSIDQARNYLAKSKALATFLWSANQQGLGSGKNPPPPHKERTFIVTDSAIVNMQSILGE